MPPSEGHRVAPVIRAAERGTELDRPWSSRRGRAGEYISQPSTALPEGSYWKAKGAGKLGSHSNLPWLFCQLHGGYAKLVTKGKDKIIFNVFSLKLLSVM